MSAVEEPIGQFGRCTSVSGGFRRPPPSLSDKTAIRARASDTRLLMWIKGDRDYRRCSSMRGDNEVRVDLRQNRNRQ